MREKWLHFQGRGSHSLFVFSLFFQSKQLHKFGREAFTFGRGPLQSICFQPMQFFSPSMSALKKKNPCNNCEDLDRIIPSFEGAVHCTLKKILFFNPFNFYKDLREKHFPF